MAAILAPGVVYLRADSQLGVFIPPNSMTDNSGYYVQGEALFLKPNSDPFVINGIGNSSDDDWAGLDGLSSVDVINSTYGRDGGFRAAIGRNVPNSPLDLSLEVTGIYSDDTTDVEAEPGGSLGIIFPVGEGGDNSAEMARARTDLDMFYGDLMAKYNIKFGQNSWLFTMGAGLRFAHVQHDIIRQYLGSADCPTGGFGDTQNHCLQSTKQEYWGVGPRVATKLGWDVGNGFNLFTSANLTLLSGEMDTVVRNHSNTTSLGNNITHVRVVTSRNIPILDTRVGVNWVKQITSALRLNVMLGYEFQNWFDLRDRFTSVDDDGANMDVDRSSLGLEGPFLRVGAEF